MVVKLFQKEAPSFEYLDGGRMHVSRAPMQVQVKAQTGANFLQDRMTESKLSLAVLEILPSIRAHSPALLVARLLKPRCTATAPSKATVTD
jgi:hypothetical protein